MFLLCLTARVGIMKLLINSPSLHERWEKAAAFWWNFQLPKAHGSVALQFECFLLIISYSSTPVFCVSSSQLLLSSARRTRRSLITKCRLSLRVLDLYPNNQQALRVLMTPPPINNHLKYVVYVVMWFFCNHNNGQPHRAGLRINHQSDCFSWDLWSFESPRHFLKTPFHPNSLMPNDATTPKPERTKASLVRYNDLIVSPRWYSCHGVQWRLTRL